MNTKQHLILLEFINNIYKELYKITLENVEVAEIDKKQCALLKEKLHVLEALIEQIIKVGEQK